MALKSGRTVAPRRVAIIGHHVAPIAPPFVGGVESHTWELARWLAMRGHDVTLYALAGSEVPGVRVVALDLADEHAASAAARADVSALPKPFLVAHHRYLQLMLKLVSASFDAIHINTLHYLPVAMARALPVRPTLTLHCPPTPWLESALQVARSAGELPVQTLAVSRALAASWAHVVADPVIVPNGIDLAHWLPGPGGPGAAWVGRIVPEKAPHLAVDAARQAGVPLTLAGPIIDRAYYERELAPRLTGSGAQYAGHLSPRQLHGLMSTSCVVVQSPIWDEPFGLVAAESLACGTPVAAFARGGLVEVVGGAGALAAPGDVDALATAIRAAAAVDRNVAREHARQRLSLDAMGLAYEALFAVPRASAPPEHSEHTVALTAPGAATHGALGHAATQDSDPSGRFVALSPER